MVHPGRILGAVMGLVILWAIFTLPFQAEPPKTFYQVVSPFLENIGLIASLGNPLRVAYTYILIVSFILLTVAGIVGYFPLGTGVLGLVGIGLVTIPPFLFAPYVDLRFVWGLGLYIMLGASIVSLAASFWHGKPRQR